MTGAMKILYQDRKEQETILDRCIHGWQITFLALVLLAIPAYTYSQACCSGGVPLGGSLGLGTADNDHCNSWLHTITTF